MSPGPTCPRSAASAFARATGSITILVNGRITQFGAHEALVASPGPYRELYRTQAAAYTN